MRENVCVCLCVCACMHACVCVCVRVHVCVCVSQYGFPLLQVERIWGMINGYAKDLSGDVQGLKRGPSLRKGLRKDKQWKLSLALQFNSRARDLKRLQRINKEFQEFVVAGEDRRYVDTDIHMCTYVCTGLPK